MTLSEMLSFMAGTMDDQTKELDNWDCVVVGAGVVGSFTAYHLAKHGLKILLLEQVTYL